jgi:hypothetical protein
LPNLFLGFPVSRAAFAEVAGQALVGNLPYTNLYYQTFFDSIDGFEFVLASGGTVTQLGSYIKLQATITSGSLATIQKSLRWLIEPYTWDKDSTWRSKVRLVSDNDSTMEMWMGRGRLDTNPGIGFVITGGNLYARVASPGGTTDVLIQAMASGGFDVEWSLKFVYLAAVSCKFYIDGDLKATITTNFPSGTSQARMFLHLRMKNTGGTDTGYINCGHMDCFQKA